MKDDIKNDYFRIRLIYWILISAFFFLFFLIAKFQSLSKAERIETFLRDSIGYLIFLLIFNLIGLIRLTPSERFPANFFLSFPLRGEDTYRIVHTIIFLVLSVIYIAILRYFLY